MQRRGFIIRFIDIGLLLLFGFLMISDLKGTAQISFNDSTSKDFFSLGENESVLLGVTIKSDNRLSIRDINESEMLQDNILSIEELEFAIDTLRKRFNDAGKEVSVLIEPTPDAQVQYVVHVLDVCDRLGLKKNLNTEAARAENESS